MRHIRTRRRFKVILILLFIMCLTVFLENRIEDLVPQLKSLAEAKVEDALGGKVNFTIGSIDGGIIHPIVLNDIRVSQRDVSQLTQSLVIDSIRTNYYAKDIINAIVGSALPPLLNKNSSAYINFSVKSGEIRGFIGVLGDLSDSKIDGYLMLFNRGRINFSGHTKDGKFDFEVSPDGHDMGSVRLSGALSQADVFKVDLKLNHLKLSGYDIDCSAVMKNELINVSDAPGQKRLEGKFETERLKLNYKPFVDMKVAYKLTRDLIEVNSLSLGEIVKAYGSISLKEPRKIDITLLSNNVSLSWLLLTLGCNDATSILTGTMSGKFKFTGLMQKVNMNSTFDIRGGTIGPLSFDYMTATLKGEWPFLKIEDSRITRNSGYLSVTGELDLRHAGKSNMFDRLKLVTDDTAITWDEWNSRQGKDVTELSMKKNIVGQFGFGYKKFVKEDRIDESLRDSDEVHFDYNLQANDSLKVKVAQDNDFFGFEHKDKF